MPCDASQVLANGSQFNGLPIPELKAVQLQLAAEALLQLSPAAGVSYDGIMDRAVASGISGMSRKEVRSIILQILCDIREEI